MNNIHKEAFENIKDEILEHTEGYEDDLELVEQAINGYILYLRLCERYDIKTIEELEMTIINEGTGEQAFKEYVETYVKPYKDIEEELGIELLTLFKAIKNGIFAKTKHGIQKLYCRHFTLCNFEATTNRKWGDIEYFYHTYHYKDYGKTWALTKEELL